MVAVVNHRIELIADRFIEIQRAGTVNGHNVPAFQQKSCLPGKDVILVSCRSIPRGFPYLHQHPVHNVCIRYGTYLLCPRIVPGRQVVGLQERQVMVVVELGAHHRTVVGTLKVDLQVDSKTLAKEEHVKKEKCK